MFLQVLKNHVKVFFSTLFQNILSTLWVLYSVERSAVWAGAVEAGWIVCTAYAASYYVHDRRLIPSAAVAAALGTYMTVRWF